MPSRRDRRDSDLDMKANLAPPLLPSWLAAVTTQSATAPKATLIWAGLLAALSLVIGFRFLPLSPSRADLIDPTASFHQRWLAYTEEFGDESEIVVVISGDDSVTVSSAANSVASRLSEVADVTDVLGEVDWSPLKRRSLQYATPTELTEINRLLSFGVVPSATGGAGVVPAVGRLTARLQSAGERGHPGDWNRAMLDTRHEFQSLNDRLAGKKREPFWSLPLDDRKFPQPNVFNGGKLRVVTCYPVVTGGLDGAADAVQSCRQVIGDLSAEFPDVSFGLTGVPVLEFDEMDRSARDMAIASSVSAIGVAVLLCLGFRGSRVPILALLVLSVSMAWSVGWASASVGRLNILSVSFAAILIGLGVDFALHWLAHFNDADHQFGDSETVARKSVRAAAGCGTGIATAAVTTATAFFVAGVTPFRGLAELGIIAGGGVILCAAGALVLMPAMLASWPRKSNRAGTPNYARWLADNVQQRPFAWLAGSLLLIACCTLAAFDVSENFTPRVRYNANLLDMQPVGLPSVETQQAFEDATTGGLLYAVSRVGSAEEARKRVVEYERLPEVGSVTSLGGLIPDSNVTTNDAFDSLVSLLETPLNRRFAPSDQDDAIAAIGDLEKTVLRSGAKDAAEIATLIRTVGGTIESLSKVEAMQLLDRFASEAAAEATAIIEGLRQVADRTPIDADAIPKSLRRRMIGSRGTWLVFAFPAVPVWDSEPLAKFVSAVRSVDPHVTGTPIQNLEATHQIRSSYLNACGYALAAVFLVLFLDASTGLNVALVIAAATGIAAFAYGIELGKVWNDSIVGWSLCWTAGAVVAATAFDARGAIRAFGAAVPSLVGGIVTLGALALCKIDFNPANLIVLPLVLGIGVDDGVHIIHGLRSRTGRVPAATIHALTMTSLTSAIGFGSLALSQHRGLSSLGITLVIGVSACYVVSVFALLPAAYLTRGRRREDSAQCPNNEGVGERAVTVPYSVRGRDSGRTDIQPTRVAINTRDADGSTGY